MAGHCARFYRHEIGQEPADDLVARPLQQLFAGLVDGSQVAGEIHREHHVIGVLKQVLVTLFQRGLGLQLAANDGGLFMHPAAEHSRPGQGREHDRREQAGRPEHPLKIPPRRSRQHRNVRWRTQQQVERLGMPVGPGPPFPAQFYAADAGDGHLAAVLQIGKIHAADFPLQIGVKNEAPGLQHQEFIRSVTGPIHHRGLEADQPAVKRAFQRLIHRHRHG